MKLTIKEDGTENNFSVSGFISISFMHYIANHVAKREEVTFNIGGARARIRPKKGYATYKITVNYD